MRTTGVVLAAGAVIVLAACGSSGPAASDPVLAGQLIRVGGPAPGAPVPLGGQIDARDNAGHEYTVSVGPDGRFRLRLPPGTYRLTGHSPQIQDGKALCTATKPVSVTGNGPLNSVKVICQIS